MAQPPTLRTLRLEDLGDAASPELESLLGILNAFMGEVTNALQGRLTRGDNILSQGRTGVKFRTPASGAHVCSVAHGLPQPVKHALGPQAHRQRRPLVGVELDFRQHPRRSSPIHLSRSHGRHRIQLQRHFRVANGLRV
jgi:hypothetical protein